MKAVLTCFRAVRVHQWSKNILVFAPLISAHHWYDSAAWLAGVKAFFAFSFAASAGYLINDLRDRESDRKHPRKKSRPIASGAFSTIQALVTIPILLTAALGLSLTLSPEFTALIGFYFATSVTYSWYIKSKVALDVVTLALLYTLRIFAGTLVAQVPLTNWFLAFAFFFFITLAVLKRYSELKRTTTQTALAGRGYLPGDSPIVAAFGITTGVASILVLALYVNAPENALLYVRPDYLWGLCLLLFYWIFQLWIRAARGEIVDDPLIYAFTDRLNYLLVIAAGALLTLAKNG